MWLNSVVPNFTIQHHTTTLVSSTHRNLAWSLLRLWIRRNICFLFCSRVELGPTSGWCEIHLLLSKCQSDNAFWGPPRELKPSCITRIILSLVPTYNSSIALRLHFSSSKYREINPQARNLLSTQIIENQNYMLNTGTVDLGSKCPTCKIIAHLLHAQWSLCLISRSGNWTSQVASLPDW